MAVPTLTTLAAAFIEATRANSGGNISSNGGKTITERGICWNTAGTPTTSDSKVSDALSTTGLYYFRATGLSASTTYYIRAYAINADGTGYGAQVSFTTNADIAPVFNNLDIGYKESDIEATSPVFNNLDVGYKESDIEATSPVFNNLDISFGRPIYVEPLHPIFNNLDISFGRPVYEIPQGYGNAILFGGGI